MIEWSIATYLGLAIIIFVAGYLCGKGIDFLPKPRAKKDK